MKPLISIIYAHRNRDIQRINLSFNSLRKQLLQNFEVIFVDYGSDKIVVSELEVVAGNFNFIKIHALKVPQVLWNKSKALNYGIKEASGQYIFIADVDLIFHPRTTELLQKIKTANSFYLFELGYLNRKDSRKLLSDYTFEALKPERFGRVNGMILTSRESLLKINGLDEFFHFYGAEDEDLFSRLETAGYNKMHIYERYFYHQWHQSFSGSEDKLITANPRMKNIMRLNQRHYERNRKNQIIKPLKQGEMGIFISEEASARLKNPSSKYKIPNIQAYVEHFLREELNSKKGLVVEAEFYEDETYFTWKYKLKSLLGRQTQPFLSLKEINDLVLKEIVFNYRNHNYSFRLGKNQKNIIFCIEV